MDSLNIKRRTTWPLWVLALALVAAVLGLGRPHTTPGAALDLTHNEDEVPVLRNAKGELLMYNFRAVEPGVLYRSSGFPRNRKIVENGETKKIAAAFADDQVFDFLRKRNIHTIVMMQEQEYFWAEQGYFEWWQKRTGYKVNVVPLSVKAGHAYDQDSGGALRASSKFLDMMKARKPQDGAVLIHCDAGKDRTGVAVALYELWRNQGKMNKDELWAQVRNRYLASNPAIGSDKETSAWAAPQIECRDCGNGKSGPGFVCGEWLDKLRPNLELLAQL
jgi:protein-tyrosine phosphatase